MIFSCLQHSFINIFFLTGFMLLLIFQDPRDYCYIALDISKSPFFSRSSNNFVLTYRDVTSQTSSFVNTFPSFSKLLISLPFLNSISVGDIILPSLGLFVDADFLILVISYLILFSKKYYFSFSF